MTSFFQSLLSLKTWKTAYHSTPVFIIRHCLAAGLLLMGILGLLLAEGAGFANLLISLGCLALAGVLAFWLLCVALLSFALITWANTLSISGAIILGSLLISAALLLQRKCNSTHG